MCVNMLRLVTFGGLALERRDGAPPPRLRPQRLAILAVLGAAGDRGVVRERMSGLFWPDADEARARHSLRQALYALRQELGEEVVTPDAILSLASDPVARRRLAAGAASRVAHFSPDLVASEYRQVTLQVLGPHHAAAVPRPSEHPQRL